MAVAHHIKDIVASSSFIRKMFETGMRLRAEHGADKVCDFSLGNPSLPPPQEFSAVLTRLASEPFPGKHAYMPNAGYPDVRSAVAAYVTREYACGLSADGIIMTCGAGGGLNVILKTLLNPGDEVLASLPCFMEYRFYCQNHGGNLVTVPCLEDFSLDLAAIERAITPKTAAMIINSPNNPSGKVYPSRQIEALAELLDRKGREIGRTIYLISDEPYRKISFGVEVPSILAASRNSIVVTSYSKELSIPGERIGWIAINPACDDARTMFDGAVVCNRILGYVNAPALMQKAVGESLGISVDANIYRRKRDLLCRILGEIGYDFIVPEGTFYLFPKAPGGDDAAFIDVLQKYLVLAVPGRGFGLPGFFRISYCVDDAVIERSASGFAAAWRDVMKMNPQG